MIPLSVLDLAPIVEGGDAAQSFRNSRDLAQHTERWGYRRFWLAEHHSMPGIASAATAVLIAHVAEGTSKIRVGAGGIMLPNHAPLVIAEQFGTLESLYSGRIDLGLGRAPGSDPVTARALRRNLDSSVDQFPNDVVELMTYFRDPQPGQLVRAVPGSGLKVPIWILGSSLFGAQLAAALGLPFAFASHFAPAQLMPAIDIYRQRFQPSEQLAKPYVWPDSMSSLPTARSRRSSSRRRCSRPSSISAADGRAASSRRSAITARHSRRASPTFSIRSWLAPPSAPASGFARQSRRSLHEPRWTS
jgi:luciferase family oxidoreductase group 1